MRRTSLFLTASVFFLALANSLPGGSLDLSTWFPIKQHDNWGCIDQTGKIARVDTD
jgi:hypothetical protein